VFGQNIGEGLIGESLQIFAAVARQKLESLPGLGIEADNLRLGAMASLLGRSLHQSCR
jgi:hypothetical protein